MPPEIINRGRVLVLFYQVKLISSCNIISDHDWLMHFYMIINLDVLLYLGDGFLFFLKLFYKYISANKVDDPWENQIIFQMEGDTTNRIYKALLVSITIKIT